MQPLTLMRRPTSAHTATFGVYTGGGLMGNCGYVMDQ